MNTSTNVATSLPANPSPGDLSDAELLGATRSLVGRSNQLLAALLAHLGEVEARGIHRKRACSSLYVYCIYELRFSEDEAFRRVSAARLVRRFPALWDAVASGELHLTGLLMLGPHLTEQNLGQVLLRAKHRTKKELARLVRELDPLPGVPPRIEPLGPAPARGVVGAPTWEKFVASLCPVRELTPGDRPRDWMANTNDDEMWAPVGRRTPPVTDTPAETGTQLRTDPPNASPGTNAPAGTGTGRWTDAPAETGMSRGTGTRAASESAPESLCPQRYKVQFTATEEYVKLIDEARALLSHSAPRATLDEIQLRAMRVFVAELKRRKQGATTRPRKPKSQPEPTLSEGASTPMVDVSSDNPRQRKQADDVTTPATDPRQGVQTDDVSTHGSDPRQRVQSDPTATRARDPRQRVQTNDVSTHGSDLRQRVPADDSTQASEPEHPRQREPRNNPTPPQEPEPPRRSRHIPASIRRAVFERDEGRCTYSGSSERRCAETHRLELHHLTAFAKGGEHTLDNLTLRCHAHNALAAEEDFGRELIELARSASDHEPWAVHPDP